MKFVLGVLGLAGAIGIVITANIVLSGRVDVALPPDPIPVEVTNNPLTVRIPGVAEDEAALMAEQARLRRVDPRLQEILDRNLGR